MFVCTNDETTGGRMVGQIWAPLIMTPISTIARCDGSRDTARWPIRTLRVAARINQNVYVFCVLCIVLRLGQLSACLHRRWLRWILCCKHVISRCAWVFLSRLSAQYAIRHFRWAVPRSVSFNGLVTLYDIYYSLCCDVIRVCGVRV